MRYRELEKLLRENGWHKDNTGKGSHIMFRKESRKIPVPRHSGDIPIGTLNNILKMANLK